MATDILAAVIPTTLDLAHWLIAIASIGGAFVAVKWAVRGFVWCFDRLEDAVQARDDRRYDAKVVSLAERRTQLKAASGWPR